ncbi:MAG: hypothetical protein HOP19_12485, partial [Acidobacteria bacterium]|nr:hypothetical protein [Acidobacteriota bacterium]
MPDSLAQRAALLYHFWRTRQRLRFASRAELLDWQVRQVERFVREVLPRAPFYREFQQPQLSELPLLDKSVMMAEFDRLNTRGIRKDAAFDVALRAEQSRDFSPVLDGITVGLSSGTSGNRGVFLVSPAERAQWAGTMLAKALPAGMIGELLTGRLPQLRIAFFLRANSNLYTTLKQRRIDFAFYDLWQDFESLLSRLHTQQPHFLVAPAYVLRLLAEAQRAGTIAIQPRKIFSVAEVLEPQDESFIQATFGLPVAQIYQATEGFLGITCAHGTLHLNEELIHVEPQWLDEAKTC